MTTETFGNLPDGQNVSRVTLQGGGLTARILTYGAILQDLRLDGHDAPLVLGLNSLADYVEDKGSIGITAGRCANRIGHGRFTLDGKTYQLYRNEDGTHHLHGGSEGCGRQNWRLEESSEDRATLALDLADGHMGYPGNIRIRATFAVKEAGVLEVVYEAESDAPTLCNLAHHSYFTLTGGDGLSGHTMRIASDGYTDVDDALIPTGEVLGVAGTAYDFREGVDLGQWPQGQLLDHNFCLSDGRVGLREVAELTTARLAMSIRTTEPGLQVYNGAKLDVPVPGLDDTRYGPYSGIAIEPQVWPDAINHAGFPSAILRPGAPYRQVSQFVFSRR